MFEFETMFNSYLRHIKRAKERVEISPADKQLVYFSRFSAAHKASEYRKSETTEVLGTGLIEWAQS